ncbi:MAG: hypothetical protein QOJ69_1315 [Actinomycetota bacterium]|nr:hypothetical protein [Actinomycetota bacterium]
MAPRTVEQIVERVGRAEWLDKLAQPLSKKVSETVPKGPVKDALSGTWLGHPLHPMLTDLPIGCWTSAFMLDLVGGKRSRRASDTLVALGLVTALPTAASGLADWSDLIGEERRLGLAHAGGNTVAVVFYGLSLVSRLRGRRGKGIVLSLLGATAATAGAYLGGHLAWRKGVNVSRHAWQHAREDWVDVAAEEELAADGPLVVTVGDDTVLVVRQDGKLYAISDVCGHLGGPLHEGEIGAGCVTCPWHASVFRLDDGSVVHGPATGPQPAYQVLRKGGRLWVRQVSRLEPQPVPGETEAVDMSWDTSPSTVATGASQA